MKINEVQADARGKIYLRTEDGIDSYMSVKDALSEVNDAMMGRVVRERSTRKMSSSQGHHVIEYRDGRRVTLKEIDAPVAEEKGPKAWTGEETRIVTVKGKRYAVGQIVQAGPTAYVSYWSERDGKTFGATRGTNRDAKPGTVGRAIWDAVNR
ncbi:hypothetical protein ACWF2L_17665 [Streptomyces anulatus]